MSPRGYKRALKNQDGASLRITISTRRRSLRIDASWLMAPVLRSSGPVVLQNKVDKREEGVRRQLTGPLHPGCYQPLLNTESRRERNRPASYLTSAKQKARLQIPDGHDAGIASAVPTQGSSGSRSDSKGGGRAPAFDESLRMDVYEPSWVRDKSDVILTFAPRNGHAGKPGATRRTLGRFR